MNVEHLRLFTRVAVTQNISQAGSELGLSAAVASSHINKLEKSLETRLIHRTTRSVTLTEDGQAFLPYAEDVLASVEAAHSALGKGNRSPSGKLRITAPASFGRMHIMPFMREFLTAFPDITVDCRFSDSIVDLVEGGFDIAIRNAPLKNSGLVARKLCADKRLLCASPEYLQQNGTPKTPQDLRQHQCVVINGLDTWAFEAGDKTMRVKVDGRFRTDNGEAMREASVQGLGISINALWSVFEQLKRGELVSILDDYTLADEPAIWAVYPSSRQLAPKVRAFIDFFATVYGETPYWCR